MRQLEMVAGIQEGEYGLLGRAAEAEAQRRILTTAIALERFRNKHGLLPKRLEELAPEFLKTVLRDFMDGAPLHFRPSVNGRFLLYSVGLDCTDNAGAPRPPGNLRWLDDHSCRKHRYRLAAACDDRCH